MKFEVYCDLPCVLEVHKVISDDGLSSDFALIVRCDDREFLLTIDDKVLNKFFSIYKDVKRINFKE